MIQTTQNWKDFSIDHSNYHPLIVVIKNGNIIWTFDSSNIKEGSLRFTDDITDLGDFNIGATPSNSFECDIINFDNTFPSPSVFKGCKANLYFFLGEQPEFGGSNAVVGQAIVGQAIVGTESTWTDYIKRGVYYLDPVDSVGRTVHISGYDAMSLAEFNSANMSGFSFSGLTCFQAIKKMGFNLQHEFPNSDYVLPNVVCNEESNLANITKRTALGYIASLCGCYARHDNTGELRLEQFNPNVLVYPYYQTTRTASGITFTDNGDGTITADGTATADVFFYCARYSTDYGVGQYFLTGCPDGGSHSTYSMYMYVDNAYSWDFGKGNYVTVKETPSNEAIIIKIGNGTKVENMLFTPQLKKVSAYVGNYESIPIPYSLADGTTSDITYAQDGHSVTFNGTASATFNYRVAGWTIAQGAIKLDPNKKYYLCGTPDGSSTSTYIISCRCYAPGVTPGSNTGYIVRDFGWGTYITGCDYVSIYFTIYNGQTVENLEVKPRLYEVAIDKVMQEPILDYYPVEVTGVFVSGTDGAYSVKGSDGYYLFVENNPFIVSNSIANEVATFINTAYNGLSIYPFSLSFIADPSLQAGNTIDITYNGNTITTIVGSFQYGLGQQSTLSMDADTEEHSSAEALIASVPGTKLAIQDLYKGDVLKKIINLSADEVQIDAQQMNINGVVSANGNFKVNLDGTIEAVNGKFSGNITSQNGKIGNWNIDEYSYYGQVVPGYIVSKYVEEGGQVVEIPGTVTETFAIQNYYNTAKYPSEAYYVVELKAHTDYDDGSKDDETLFGVWSNGDANIKNLNDNGSVNESYLDHTFLVSGGISAGTVGTRGGEVSYTAPQNVRLTKIVSIASSASYMPIVSANGKVVTLSYYRATASAISQADSTVVVRLYFGQ